MNSNKRLPSLLAGALLLALCPPGAHARSAGTSVHLFEWSWPEVAKECPKLAAKGYDAVQVSPPNEHIGGPEWWARYQPVSYKIESRGGDRAAFAAMVAACHAVGVKIYADAVINHTADLVLNAKGSVAGEGSGVGGSPYHQRYHPAIPYGPEHYHATCRTDYNVAQSIQSCMLGRTCDQSGLPDLDTAREDVQQTIAAYMKDLASLGVDGLRIDAAKHMAPTDLEGIYNKAGKPFVYQEVIEAGGEPVRAAHYTHLGMVTDFVYGEKLAEKFKASRIADLRTFGKNWGLVESGRAVVFVDNHDRERGHGGGGNLTYRDGARYNLASVFELGWPYGYPNVLSSYQWDGKDANAGPRGPVDCDNPDFNGRHWVCQHRWGNIANMVAYRRTAVEGCRGVNDTLVDYWWNEGDNRIGFGCMDKGYLVINNDDAPLKATLRTGMQPGHYCNILSNDAPCGGEKVEVKEGGELSVSVAGKSALAIHVNARP